MKLPNDEIVHYRSDDGVTVIVERTELVRCKDCKYEKTCCRNVIDDPEGVPAQIDYCSYGEREDGDEHECE